MTEVDTLRSDVVKPAVRAGLERYAAAKEFSATAHASLETARSELQAAASASDGPRATSAARLVNEATILVEACAVPELDGDTLSHIRRAVDRVLARFTAEVSLPRRREHVEERARLAPAWNAFASRYSRWAPTGVPAEEGVALLALASWWADRIDNYLRDNPIPPRAEEALAHAAPRPVLPHRQFINLSDR